MRGAKGNPMMTRQQCLETPTKLSISAWRDPLVEAAGHRHGKPLCGNSLVGNLGPASAWCWQRTARVAAASKATVTIDAAELATGIGLGTDPSPACGRFLGRQAHDWTARVPGGDSPSRRVAGWRKPAVAPTDGWVGPWPPTSSWRGKPARPHGRLAPAGVPLVIGAHEPVSAQAPTTPPLGSAEAGAIGDRRSRPEAALRAPSLHDTYPDGSIRDGLALHF